MKIFLFCYFFAIFLASTISAIRSTTPMSPMRNKRDVSRTENLINFVNSIYNDGGRSFVRRGGYDEYNIYPVKRHVPSRNAPKVFDVTSWLERINRAIHSHDRSDDDSHLKRLLSSMRIQRIVNPEVLEDRHPRNKKKKLRIPIYQLSRSLEFSSSGSEEARENIIRRYLANYGFPQVNLASLDDREPGIIEKILPIPNDGKKSSKHYVNEGVESIILPADTPFLARETQKDMEIDILKKIEEWNKSDGIFPRQNIKSNERLLVEEWQIDSIKNDASSKIPKIQPLIILHSDQKKGKIHKKSRLMKENKILRQLKNDDVQKDESHESRKAKPYDDKDLDNAYVGVELGHGQLKPKQNMKKIFNDIKKDNMDYRKKKDQEATDDSNENKNKKVLKKIVRTDLNNNDRNSENWPNSMEDGKQGQKSKMKRMYVSQDIDKQSEDISKPKKDNIWGNNVSDGDDDDETEHPMKHRKKKHESNEKYENIEEPKKPKVHKAYRTPIPYAEKN